MAVFLRPGTHKTSEFGISFESDRDEKAPSIIKPPSLHQDRPLQQQRQRLPIFSHRNDILFLIEHHPTTIIVGETGSGKTTQVPQYLYEAGWTNTSPPSIIACTQPRRVAAMTVAARVAQEMGCRLGAEVGYSIRFEDVSTPGTTKIKFLTDGVLLREMMEDPLLLKYSVVMVDEAHERSLTTDLLLGLLRKIQKKRPDLRVIISSATMEAESLAKFFNKNRSNNKNSSIVSVQGRMHDVQVHYLAFPCSNYVQSAVEAVVEIHLNNAPGDVLIFLTGQEECDEAVAMLEAESKRLEMMTSSGRGGGQMTSSSSPTSILLPLPLYAGLPAAHQLAVFEPTPRGYRKVVVATNIAETSVTIEGIVYVVDCMHAKQRCFNPLSGLESLLVAPISKASATQRAGRAGRLRPGHCFRLCTEDDYRGVLPDTIVPEIQRSNLAGSILQLKSLGIENIMTFDWLAAPSAEAVIRGLETLHALGTLGDDARLTDPLGIQVSELPLDPVLGRILLAGGEMGCAAEVATIIAMLSVQSVWWLGGGEKRAQQHAKAKFAVSQGDLLTYLNVWKAWEDSGRNKKWAVQHYINHRSMLRAADIRRQLGAHLHRLRISNSSGGGGSSSGNNDNDNMVDTIQKALTCGLFINAARLLSDDEVVRHYGSSSLSDDRYSGGVYHLIRTPPSSSSSSSSSMTAIRAIERLCIHPSSVLYKCRPQWVCFYNAQQSDDGWYEMHDVVAIQSEWLTELAPHMYTTT